MMREYGDNIGAFLSDLHAVAVMNIEKKALTQMGGALSALLLGRSSLLS